MLLTFAFFGRCSFYRCDDMHVLCYSMSILVCEMQAWNLLVGGFCE